MVHTFADKAAAKATVQVTGLTSVAKCTWIIKASKDAPGFRVTTTDASRIADADVALHYVEYSADSEFRLDAGSPTDFIDGTKTANTPKGRIYDQTMFVGGELPKFFQIVNPSDPESRWKKRFVAGSAASEQVAQQTTEYSAFTTERDQYELLRQEYLAAITPQAQADTLTAFFAGLYPEGQAATSTATTLPTRPTRPNGPYEYTGFRLKTSAASVSPASNEL